MAFDEYSLKAKAAYLKAVEMLDTWGVARPPPPNPAIASDIAGPQKAWILKSIICVKLCCHMYFHMGMSLVEDISAARTDAARAFSGVGTVVLESAII